MWGADGKLHDIIAAIPDRCYSTLFQAIIEDCKAQRRLRSQDHGLGARTSA